MTQKKAGPKAGFSKVVRPERFERPTPKFVAWCSIQLSYGRKKAEAELCVSDASIVNEKFTHLVISPDGGD